MSCIWSVIHWFFDWLYLFLFQIHLIRKHLWATPFSTNLWNITSDGIRMSLNVVSQHNTVSEASAKFAVSMKHCDEEFAFSPKFKIYHVWSYWLVELCLVLKIHQTGKRHIFIWNLFCGCSMSSIIVTYFFHPTLSCLFCLPDFHLPIQKPSTLGDDEVSRRENSKGYFEQGANQQGLVLLWKVRSYFIIFDF